MCNYVVEISDWFCWRKINLINIYLINSLTHNFLNIQGVLHND
jgi:hypothetical protein